MQDTLAAAPRRHLLACALFACGLLAACGGGGDTAEPALSDAARETARHGPTPTTLSLRKIGGCDGGAGEGAAEISAFDARSKRLFVSNGADATIDVLDLSDPAAPVLAATIPLTALGAGATSVAVHKDMLAVAIAANVKTDPGLVALYDAASLRLLQTLPVGALPDMLAFTPNGRHLLVANEGEPNSYAQPDSVDPEGSVSIIDVRRHGRSTVRTADFKRFIGREAELRARGIRIYGPGANAAQDFEPEYITVGDRPHRVCRAAGEQRDRDIVDIRRAEVLAVKPLGFKDHRRAGFGLDASDEDGGADTNSGTPSIKIGPQPLKGMYQPDVIASYTVRGQTFLISANEGDAREYIGFEEEVRVRAYCSAAGLDESVFGADAQRLLFDSNLGRLRITATPNDGRDGKNAAGQCNELFAYGARSFSIRSSDIALVYDSGDDFEQRTTARPNVAFNAGNDDNELDARSPAKGPEPEGITVGRFGRKTFAFIGLERVGGVMVYDVSDPRAPVFTTYLNTRDGEAGDRGPEGLTSIPARQSPNGKPLLVVANEVSGTTAVLQIDLVR